MEIELKDGMKLRVAKGDTEDGMFMTWIAGRVPVGAVGVVSIEGKHPVYPMFRIDFPDHPIEPDKAARGYFRALSSPTYEFEIVENPS